MSTVSELRKRKKSLNQIVNPTVSSKPISMPQANPSSFRQVPSKSKLKNTTIGVANASPYPLVQPPVTFKAEPPKSNSRKPMSQKDLVVLEKEQFSQTLPITSQNSYYYFPEPQYLPGKTHQTPVTTETQTTTHTTNPSEVQQHTTNKKLPKPSKNCMSSHLEFSNNSSKTQLIHPDSCFKGQSNSKGNSSDCIEISFSHTMVPEGELLCQETLGMNEEINENTFFPGKELEQEKMQEEIIKEEFQQECGFEYDQETLEILIRKEYEYSPNASYFKNQKNINPHMRAILLDWMMEVSNEFSLKRETFHMAVNFVDRILSVKHNVVKNELQLIGIVSMFMASKNEEVSSPSISDFALSADNAFNLDQIREKEQEFFKLLKFMIHPPTHFMWCNWLMAQWDLYFEHSDFAKSHPVKKKFNNIPSFFKQPNEESYALFREVMQLVDCAILDVESLQYRPRAIILSILYLVLGKNYQQFDESQIISQMPLCNSEVLSREYIFNDLFANFIFCCLGTELSELLPYIQYCSKFFGLVLNFDLPTATKNNKKQVLEGHFEEFLAYQTHNPNHLEFFKKRRNLHK